MKDENWQSTTSIGAMHRMGVETSSIPPPIAVSAYKRVLVQKQFFDLAVIKQCDLFLQPFSIAFDSNRNHISRLMILQNFSDAIKISNLFSVNRTDPAACRYHTSLQCIAECQ